MLSASAPASRPVALAAALASLSSSRAFLYLPKRAGLRVGRRGSGARQRGGGQRGAGAQGRRTSAGLRAAHGALQKARAAGGSGHAAAAQAARGGPGRPGRPGVAR
eukprot:scaffold120591_cov48-Phaeocystis_antarctica.AAC.2